MYRILSREQMASAEKLAMVGGRDRRELMEIASRACCREVLRRWPDSEVIVLCGPGGNGEDGLVIAGMLSKSGRPVQVLYFGQEDEDLPGKVEASGWRGGVNIVDESFDGEFDAVFSGVDESYVIVDALYGLGLNRALTGKIGELIETVNTKGIPVLSVDIPSGLNADLAETDDIHIIADVTVTFEALKPVHILEPAASACGDIVVAPLNLGEDMIACTGAPSFLNDTDAWSDRIPWPARSDHKHKRGRIGVLSGPPGATGAARMAATASLRMGGGVVTMMAEPAAVRELSIANLEVMNRAYASQSDMLDQMADKDVVIIGPAAGVNVTTRQAVLSLLRAEKRVVIDADAISVFSEDPRTLMDALNKDCVLTPHMGEFVRVFPDIPAQTSNKIEAVKLAQERAGCTIVLKGADTVIASTEGGVRVNVHSAPWLATAGSGDVLAGMVGGLLAQGMSAFDAACAAVWMHGEAGMKCGPGMIAGDLLDQIPAVLQSLYPEPIPNRAERNRKVITDSAQ